MSSFVRRQPRRPGAGASAPATNTPLPAASHPDSASIPPAASHADTTSTQQSTLDATTTSTPPASTAAQGNSATRQSALAASSSPAGGTLLYGYTSAVPAGGGEPRVSPGSGALPRYATETELTASTGYAGVSSADSALRRGGGVGGIGGGPGAGVHVAGDSPATWQGCQVAPGGRVVVSTGMRHLDTLGGGIPLGCLLLIEEDPFSPLHLVLLRYFLAQGVAHRHSTLLGCPLPSPQAFLATLPPPRAQPAAHQGQAEGELRIAWQYGRLGTQQQASPGSAFCTEFDLRSPLPTSELRTAQRLCHCTTTLPDRAAQCSASAKDPASDSGDSHRQNAAIPGVQTPAESLHFRTSPVSSRLLALESEVDAFFRASSGGPRGEHTVRRVAIQGLGCPPLLLTDAQEQWQALRVVQNLKAHLRYAKGAVAIVTVPKGTATAPEGVTVRGGCGSSGALSPSSMAHRLRHMADIVIETISLEESRFGPTLKSRSSSGDSSALGFLRILKCKFPNTEVPFHLETSTLCARLAADKRSVICEGLMIAPLDPEGEAGPSGAPKPSSLGCSDVGSASPLAF